MTNHLFQEPAQDFGRDLAAMNVARAREHGVPGFNRFRRFCHLPDMYSWSDMLHHMSNSTVDHYHGMFRSAATKLTLKWKRFLAQLQQIFKFSSLLWVRIWATQTFWTIISMTSLNGRWRFMSVDIDVSGQVNLLSFGFTYLQLIVLKSALQSPRWRGPVVCRCGWEAICW